MYEDLLTALRGVARCGGDPMVNMFSTARMAADCAGAIQAMNERLEQLKSERDRYREDSVVLSLLVLRGGGDVRALSAQARKLLGPGGELRETGS